jgi:hypothetical protein
MDEQFKTQIVTSKVETDDLTYAKVTADQVCKVPLIPAKSPTKQLKWAVTIEKGAIYNPEKRTGIYAETVRIGYSARINSSVYARRLLELEYGAGAKGYGMVLGSVTSSGDVQIIEPRIKMGDFTPKPIIIYGPVIGRRVSIRGQAIIMGPVIGYEKVTIDGRVVVHGIVQSVRGGVQANGLFCHGIVAGNQPVKTAKGSVEKPMGIKLGDKVSVLHPIIWLKSEDGGISMAAPVRIISRVCLNCPPTNLLVCNQFQTKACMRKDQVRSLTQADIMRFSGGLLVNDAWRARSFDAESARAVIERNLDYLAAAKDFNSLWNAFKEDELQGYMTTEDLAPKITQEITNIQETIMGDKIGTKVDVKDSVLMRSNIVAGDTGGNKGGIKDDDDFHSEPVVGDKTAKNVDVKGSVMMRSNIGPGPAEKTLKCPWCGIDVKAGTPRCPNCNWLLSLREE